MTRVSVVIPAYNAESTIVRAVTSVLRQTFQAHEIIIVDDCSTDATAVLISSLIEQTNSVVIKLIRHRFNQGAASARNTGIDAACGEWVALLDADDSWHPEKLKIQMDAVCLHPEARIVGSDYVVVGDDNDIEEISELSASNVREISLVSCLCSNPFVTPSVVFKKVGSPRFNETQRFMEDHFFLMNGALSGSRLIKVDEKLVYLYKAEFGQSGLSSHIFRMQYHDSMNYFRLYRLGLLAFPYALLLVGWSFAKFIRRLLLVLVRRLLNGQIW
jgi:glycosyltransferase involved in cell wall biosynthesis